MKRVDVSTADPDLFGPGRGGFTDGVAGSVPPTIFESTMANALQEEIARAIEARGVALDPDDLGQLGAVLLALTQNIVRPDSEDALLSSYNTAGDHPSSANNRWKLQLYFPLTSAGVVRFFSGGGSSGNNDCWAITVNAGWSAAPAQQQWSKDDSTHSSSLLRATLTELHWYTRDPGAGTWTDDQWDDQGRGVLSVGDTINTKNLSAGNDITATHDIHASNDLIADHELLVTGSVFVGTNSLYYYYPAASRTTVIPHQLAIGAGGAFLTTVPGSLTLPANSRVEFPLRLPSGAKLGVVNVCVSAPDGTAASWSIDITKQTPNFSTGAFGATTPSIGNGSGTVTAVSTPDVASANGNNATIAADSAYWVTVGNTGPGNLGVSSVQLNWSDPGPRNH